MEALGYILLFYIGFYFYRLGENHKKNKWLIGFLGIGFFVVSYMSFLVYWRFINSEESTIGIIAFFISLIFTVIMFQFLSFIWNRKKKLKSNVIDKIGEE